ncbi:MAG: hypothetical protein QOF20_2701 [Acidimicrobiaceae bacterium]|jgi:hypothetical protein|nr:hypothetical protein [Acidimicrobiaceae bacterium]MDQ1365286.1 hypothetical protein [Acidimicrobiaceae bacterium]MDQ1370348.1 hypothetical protein [Acidimicrobiaceae bacterium]MDQ1378438.1 hypothetical protein [Acidimicrobiaceae bacterium]MDQ1400460.1 hypothetical protein [Acidimicrobiaceae bacterium]
MSVWFSVEVLDGASSAALWSEAYGDALVEAALLTGATEWNWHRHSWGVVLELEFAEEDAWDRFRELTSVQAALDAVPDPLTGLVVYRGRGGSAGTWAPRPRRPLIGCGSAALPLPWALWESEEIELFAPLLDRRLAVAVGASLR